jgi:hypothetical protein
LGFVSKASLEKRTKKKEKRLIICHDELVSASRLLEAEINSA